MQHLTLEQPTLIFCWRVFARFTENEMALMQEPTVGVEGGRGAGMVSGEGEGGTWYDGGEKNSHPFN